MRNNLYFNPHIILPKTRDTHTRPDRFMIRNPFPKITNHGIQRLVVDGHMIRINAIYLLPPFSASVLESELDVFKGLVYLGVDFFIEFACFGIPAACINVNVSLSDVKLILAGRVLRYLVRRIRCCLRLALPGCI